jgi:hypothetical protein
MEKSLLLSHATKECEVTNFLGQASDAYAYVGRVQGSLFSWITLYLAPFKHKHKHQKLTHEN